MPASIPGDSKTAPAANPAAGKVVLLDLLSGPKNSPFDAQKIDYTSGSPLGWAANRTLIKLVDVNNRSTGALNTGIGFGCPPVIGLTPPASIVRAGFQDDYVPGVTKNSVAGYVASPNSSIMYIGGGKTTIGVGTGANGNGAPASWKVAAPVPYVAGFGIGGAGGGGSRDAGAGPAFTGFTLKTVTAAAGVANGGVVETGFVYRGVIGGSAIVAGAEVNLPALVLNQSVFGSAAAASAAPA